MLTQQPFQNQGYRNYWKPRIHGNYWKLEIQELLETRDTGTTGNQGYMETTGNQGYRNYYKPVIQECTGNQG